MRKYPSTEDRFWAKVNKTEGCWLWTGRRNNGYGFFRLGNRTSPARAAHRIAYQWLIGPISEGLTLDHLCRNRACVRPDHLEPVSLAENVMRGEGVHAKRARQSHCRHGHIFDLFNTGYRNGNRWCRVCHNNRKRVSTKRLAIAVIAPLLAVLGFLALAVLVTPERAQATHEGESHCAQDPNADHYIDVINDLNAFATAFGEYPAPAHLDFMPIPLGDGSVSVISEIANVAGMAFQSCIGAFSGSPTVQMMTEPQPMRTGLYGCGYNLSFPGVWFGPGYVQLQAWAGGVGCFADSGGYSVSCTIGVQSLINGQWELRAAIPTTQNAPGTICASYGGYLGHTLPCGTTSAGYYAHEYKLSGAVYHPWEEHWMLDSWDEAFVPC